MANLKDQHILILGLGASGLAMARWCTRAGAHVTVADTRDAPPQLDALRAELPQAQFIGGAFGAQLVEGTPVRAVFCSPGLSPEEVAPVVAPAQAAGLWVSGELGLFAQALAELRQSPAEQPEEAVDLKDPQESLAFMEPPEPQLAPELPPEQEQLQEQLPQEHPPEPELELQPQQQQQPGYTPVVLAVTGTNGKTTVTSLTGQLVERAGKSVAVAGNIGPSLLDTLAAALDAQALPDVWVIELSSFQLNGVQGFEPTAATVLNISQDHLDWHGSLQAYADAKSRIFGRAGLMVLNREDVRVMAMLPVPIRLKGGKFEQRKYLTFGADMPQRPGDFGIEVVNGMAWLVRALEADETQKRRKDSEEELHFQRLMPAEALRIRGRHNAVNALAALALATAAGCALGPMLYGLREYRGEPHRVEPAGIVGEIEYFDDSKGTNVGATVAALQGLGMTEAGAGGPQRKLVVILGGDGKGQDFSPLAAPVARYARAVVLIGRDGPLIRAALEGTGVSLLDAASMEDAVSQAAQRAQPGDAVLMSPACASFDMFRNYGHRAEVFRAAVQALARDAGVDLEGAA